MSDTLLVPFNGIDRTNVSNFGDNQSCYDLLNFRPSQENSGQLEQIPCPETYLPLALKNYWLSGSGTLTEPSNANTNVRMLANNVHGVGTVIATRYTIRNGSDTQLQVFQQTTVPAAVTINTHCLLIINNIAGLGITLGLTLDVEIDAAATFRWRKNGGGWTAGVACSTTGTAIDGGNATIYFLTATGFTIGQLWQWTRTDAMFTSTATVATRAFPFTHYKTDILYLDLENRLMRVRLAGTTPYSISVGYRPVYGRHFTVFDDHLIVGGYGTARLGISNDPACAVVATSDKTDLDNFFPTDINEADTYSLPTNGSISALDNYITAAYVINSILYVHTQTQVFFTPSLGLPTVFSFQFLTHFRVTTYAYDSRVAIAGRGGVYLLGQDGPWFFDGNEFKYIGGKIAHLIKSSYWNDQYVGGLYNFAEDILVFFYQANTTTISSLICYQTRSGRYYRQSVVNGTVALGYIESSSPALYMGTDYRVSNGNLRVVQSSLFSTPNTYDQVTPKITFHCLGKQLSTVKEISTVYAIFRSAAGSSNYSNESNVQYKLYWYTSTTGIIAGSPSTVAAAVRTSGDVDGLISFPRISYRAIAFEIQLAGLDGTKPPGNAFFYGLDVSGRDPSNTVKR